MPPEKRIALDTLCRCKALYIGLCADASNYGFPQKDSLEGACFHNQPIRRERNSLKTYADIGQ